MPTPQEQALLDLLPQIRKATDEVVGRVVDPLPALTPEVLLGGAALMEFEAAQRIQPGALVALDNSSRRVREARPGEPVVGVVRESRVEPHGDARIVAQQLSQVELSSLFMNPEAEAMAQLSGDGHTYASVDSEFSVEYDSEQLLEGTTTPNEATRFQVGRQDPPPMPFTRAPMPGPSDGQVVSQRGADGRFQPIARQSAQRLAQDGPGWNRASQRMTDLRALSGQQEHPTPHVDYSGPPSATPRPVQVYRPTAWERIMDDD